MRGEKKGERNREELAFMRFGAAAAAVARTQKRNKCGKRFIFGCFYLFPLTSPFAHYHVAKRQLHLMSPKRAEKPELK